VKALKKSLIKQDGLLLSRSTRFVGHEELPKRRLLIMDVDVELYKSFPKVIAKSQYCSEELLELFMILSLLKCTECGCSHDDCKASRSPLECSECLLKECCCWLTVQYEH
jgi:hypothetical protein